MRDEVRIAASFKATADEGGVAFILGFNLLFRVLFDERPLFLVVQVDLMSNDLDQFAPP
jgi:hypothetical protein